MHRPEVLRNRDFRRFFVGQSASLLGDQVAVLAIPLTAVLVLDAGPRQLGLLTAVTIGPSLLFSLIAGAWIDRTGRRRQTMLVADVVRGLAVLSLPLAHLAGHLTLAHLYAVAFVVGTFDVAFFVAYQAMLVSIVRPRDYLAANSLLNGTRSVTEVVGLSVGGTLVSLLTAPGALVLNALSFAVSGSQLARIRPDEPVRDQAPDERALDDTALDEKARDDPRGGADDHGLAAGLRWIRGNAPIRALLASTAAINLFAFVGNAVLVLFAVRTLGLSPAAIGVIFGAGAVGGVVGAVTLGRLERRIGLGRTLVVASFAYPLAMLLYPAASGNAVLAAVLLGAGEFLAAVAVLWADISLGAVFAQEIPDRLRSRVAGAYRTVNYGARPLGALLGGFLGAEVGLRNALWISAGGAICGAFLRLRPAVLQLRTRADFAP